MPYQNQIFKGLTNGRYGAKPYIDIARKKTSVSRNKNSMENSIEPKKVIIDPTAVQINNNIQNILNQETSHSSNSSDLPNGENKEKNIKNLIETETTLLPTIASPELNDQSKSIDLQEKLAIIEKYLIDMGREMDRMKTVHNEIIIAIQSLSK